MNSFTLFFVHIFVAWNNVAGKIGRIRGYLNYLKAYIQRWSPDYTNKLKRWFDSCQLVLLLCSLTVTFLYYEHLCIWKINPSCKKDCAKNCSYYTPVYIADVK